MKVENNAIIEQVSNSIPPAGGVIPTGRTTRKIKKEFKIANQSMKETGPEVAKAIKSTISAANRVGLELTVNDVSRVVREKLREINLRQDNQAIPLSFPTMYKGVSFNPQTYNKTRGKGEWIVLLDFFALMRSLLEKSEEQQLPPPRFFVLDAGLYWIINQLGGKEIKLVASSPSSAATKLMNIINLALKQKQFSEIIECNRIRNAYLRAIAQQFPANTPPPVFTLKDVWNDPEFSTFLEKAIKLFCNKDSKNQWKVISPVPYERYMPYSPWVTPLVAAEQIFIGEKLGAYGILSPTAEAGWNKTIDQFSRYMNTPTFIAWMYTRKLGKKLSYQTVPFFSDSAKTIKQKMKKAQKQDPTSNDLVLQLISLFENKEDTKTALSNLEKNDFSKVAEFIAGFLSPIEKLTTKILTSEKNIPTSPLDQVGWLAQFPPGIC